MIIKSTFKDYYDWVATKYGGGDPRIVYVRKRLVPLPEPNQIDKPLVVEIPAIQMTSPHQDSYWKGSQRRAWAFLILAGKPYLLSRPENHLLDDIRDYVLEPLVDEEDEKRPIWRRRRPRDIEFGKQRDDLVQLSQKIGHPVFIIKEIQHAWRGRPAQVTIYPQCPVLGNLGFPALIPAEQMYQDLAYFVGNLMHKTPDIQPPVEISNRQKILKAGFDLVKSFRHRK